MRTKRTWRIGSCVFFVLCSSARTQNHSLGTQNTGNFFELESEASDERRTCHLWDPEAWPLPSVGLCVFPEVGTLPLQATAEGWLPCPLIGLVWVLCLCRVSLVAKLDWLVNWLQPAGWVGFDSAVLSAGCMVQIVVRLDFTVIDSVLFA
jgi:hypothetical protein